MMSEQDIINTIDPIAKQYGVPSFVWETIAEVESGMNPRALGDNGSSYGIFQLHRGAQLGNLTPEQAYDPATNARQAMPAIAAAWNKLKSSPAGPNVLNGNQTAGNYNWWLQFAVLSGHPGGQAGDPATSKETTKLQQEAAYLSGHPLPTSGLNTSQASRQVPNTNQGGPDCNIYNPLSYGTCIQTAVPQIDHALVMIGLFFVAMVIIVAGFIAIGNGGGQA